MFPVSVAFMVLVAFGGIIVALPTYDISMYVSLIGLKLVNSASSVKNRLPKVAFEILLAFPKTMFECNRIGACALPSRVNSLKNRNNILLNRFFVSSAYFRSIKELFYPLFSSSEHT